MVARPHTTQPEARRLSRRSMLVVSTFIVFVAEAPVVLVVMHFVNWMIGV